MNIISEQTIGTATYKIERTGPQHFIVTMWRDGQHVGYRNTTSAKKAHHIVNLWADVDNRPRVATFWSGTLQRNVTIPED